LGGVASRSFVPLTKIANLLVEKWKEGTKEAN